MLNKRPKKRLLGKQLISRHKELLSQGTIDPGVIARECGYGLGDGTTAYTDFYLAMLSANGKISDEDWILDDSLAIMDYEDRRNELDQSLAAGISDYHSSSQFNVEEDHMLRLFKRNPNQAVEVFLDRFTLLCVEYTNKEDIDSDRLTSDASACLQASTVIRETGYIDQLKAAILGAMKTLEIINYRDKWSSNFSIYKKLLSIFSNGMLDDMEDEYWVRFPA